MNEKKATLSELEIAKELFKSNDIDNSAGFIFHPTEEQKKKIKILIKLDEIKEILVAN